MVALHWCVYHKYILVWQIYIWPCVPAPLKWSLGIYPMMAAYYWFNIFLLCYRNGLLCPGALGHTIHTVKHYIVHHISPLKYETCQHSYQAIYRTFLWTNNLQATGLTPNNYGRNSDIFFGRGGVLVYQYSIYVS